MHRSIATFFIICFAGVASLAPLAYSREHRRYLVTMSQVKYDKVTFLTSDGQRVLDFRNLQNTWFLEFYTNHFIFDPHKGNITLKAKSFILVKIPDDGDMISAPPIVIDKPARLLHEGIGWMTIFVSESLPNGKAHYRLFAHVFNDKSGEWRWELVFREVQ